MPKFQIAHIREQGVDLIIVPLADAFGSKSDGDQNEIVDELQERAASAGLAGTVVPVWQTGQRMGFRAPRNYHPFFQSIDFQFVVQNLNTQLYW